MRECGAEGCPNPAPGYDEFCRQHGEPDWRCDDCRCLNGAYEAFCYRCGAGQPEDVPACEPILRTKVGAGYNTDDGDEVPSHTLYLVDCACGERGHQGAVWYASRERAQRSYERRAAVLALSDEGRSGGR